MPPRSAVVLGGSVAGSVTALQLSRAGWEVTLVDPELDRIADPGPRPTTRPGAPQAVHAHGFGSRGRVELLARLPDVWDALLEAGARVLSLAEMVPPQLYDGGRPGDEDVGALQVRRHTFDRVLARIVALEPLTRVRHRVTGLRLDLDGSLPAVTGVTLSDGTGIGADVVVDAGGRRSPVTRWLREAGIDQPERFDECVARYYTRHYRIEGARPRLNSGFADVHAFTCHVQLLFLGDDDTAMLAMGAHDEDPLLKTLRRPDAFEALAAANTAFADWHRVLVPDSEVFCLGAFDNRMRSMVADDRPLVTGLHQVGDALAMTNPTRGRGVTMAMLTVGALVDVLGREPGAGAAALAFEDWRTRVLLPYYRECAVTDRIASDQLRAGLAGQAVPGNAPAVELPVGHPIDSADLERAADLDPYLFRVLLRATILLDDDRHVASPDVARRVQAVLADAPPPATPEPPTGGLHDRDRLVELLATYT